VCTSQEADRILLGVDYGFYSLSIVSFASVIKAYGCSVVAKADGAIVFGDNRPDLIAFGSTSLGYQEAHFQEHSVKLFLRVYPNRPCFLRLTRFCFM
jgi:hypothetical protein